MTRPVEIQIDRTTVLAGDLEQPSQPRGIVLFAHGSGSGRHSPRNRAVAAALQRAGFATVLMDLLTPAEERVDRTTAHLRFDIPLLARRLDATTDWLVARREFVGLPVGYFGASTGAGAALIAASTRRDVSAVVSRGGRPDLAGAALPGVTAPTLLIVGGDDTAVIELNQRALRAMRCVREIAVVPGAGHLFEEPGALEQVMQLAAAWFQRHLVPTSRSAGVSP
jgi:putative phosphoribosyl transferase